MTTIWNYPTRIRFGAGEVKAVAAEAAALGARRVFIVTDPTLRRLGLHEPVERALAAANIPVEVFDGVSENPTEDNIVAAAQSLSDFGADLIVGVGGGSALDAAKLLAVRHAVALPFAELDDNLGGAEHIPHSLLPVIAIPTTAGTGSEVGRAGVVIAESTKIKTVIFSPAMLPRVAILDPEMTASMPPKVTAATGLDALTHCLEAYVATGDHPMADGIALMGLELIAKYLPRAVAKGDDLVARGAMLKAAMMGATAFQKGLGACHSLAHPLSSEFGAHHGLANALCLPAVVRFNRKTVPDKYERAAYALGVVAGGVLDEWLSAFARDLGITGSLADLGVTEKHLERLSELAVADGCHATNPRPCDRATLEELYRQSL